MKRIILFLLLIAVFTNQTIRAEISATVSPSKFRDSLSRSRPAILDNWKLSGLDFSVAYGRIRELHKVDQRDVAEWTTRIMSDNDVKNARFDSARFDLREDRQYNVSLPLLLVAGKYLGGKTLRSLELQFGLLYNTRIQEFSPYLTGGCISEETDTTFGIRQHSFNRRITFLNAHGRLIINSRAFRNKSFYTGLGMSIPVLRQVKAEASSSYRFVRFHQSGNTYTVDSIYYWTYDNDLTIRNVKHFSAIIPVGMKVYLNCNWNFFIEYQFMYHHLIINRKNYSSLNNSGSVGLRYKFGKFPGDDEEGDSPEKDVFW